MIELQPDAIGIFEQNRIISRRPLILARRADDFRTERLEKTVQLIDVGALAGAEAQVVQADALLLEGSTRMLGRAGRSTLPEGNAGTGLGV